MNKASLDMLEQVLQYLYAGGILALVWRASAILTDIRAMLKSGEIWMNEHKPIIKQVSEAVKNHQRGGYELSRRVAELDKEPPPPEFERPYLP